MSRYEELVNEFFTRYDETEIYELIIGFSGIDPPLKMDNSVLDHEQLDNLLGGNDEGHYHLTKDQWLKIIDLLNEHDFDGGFASTGEAEYLLNEEFWFDGGDASVTYDEYLENLDLWADGGGANND